MYRLVLSCLLVSRLAAAQAAPCATPPCTDAAPAAPTTPPPSPPPAAPPPTVVATPVEPSPASAADKALATAPPPADNHSEVNVEPWTMRVGGYVQAQWRTRQNSPAPFDEDGFRLARVRLTSLAEGKAGDLKLSAFVEAELAPSFTLADAFATVTRPLSKHGILALDFGQMRVPVSRQQLLSDSRLSFVDKALIATIAPDRDLGARVSYVPAGLPQIKVMAGAFNGEGRNQVQNINEGYLYAGRLELTPFGGPAPVAESAFVEPWVSVGLSIAHNKLSPGDYHENRLYGGVDVSGAYKGLSGSFEYLEVRYSYEGDPTKLPGPAYHANGFTAQLAYLLPVKLPPLRESRIEVAARVEEIDRNDTVPIAQLADPNQSVRVYTGALSYYVRSHLLKAQLAVSHFDELEDLTSTQTNATYDNDQVILQVTYRVE